MTPMITSVIGRLRGGAAIAAFLAVLVWSMDAKAETGFVGMQIQGLPEEARVAIGVDSGILVREVGLGTPANEAGIMRGDVLLEIDGEALMAFEQLVDAVRASKPGDKIGFKLLRGRETHDVEIVLGTWPEYWKEPKPGFAILPDLGVTLTSLTSDVRKQLGIRWSAKGVAVTLVPEGETNESNLLRGDVIHQVNLTLVWHPDQVLEIYRKAKKDGQKHLLLFVESYTGNRYALMPVK